LELKVSAVLPVHPLKGDILDAFRCALLLRSFVVKDVFQNIDEMQVVCPLEFTPVLEVIAKYFANYFDINVISDLEVLGRTIAADKEIKGWHKQQLLKLASPRICRSDVILTLDADVVALRDWKALDLTASGKIPTQYSAQNRDWIKDSFALVGAQPPSNLMGVTPAFLSKRVLDVLAHDLSKGGVGWMEFLAGASKKGTQWTEYMLYQAVACSHGVWNEIHCGDESLLHIGIWRKTNVNEAFLKEISLNDPVFLVNQSLRSDSEFIHDRLRAVGLPSLYDLPSDLVAAIYDALLACEGLTKRRAIAWKYALPIITHSQSDSGELRHRVISARQKTLNQGDTLSSRLFDAIEEEDYKAAVSILMPMLRKSNFNIRATDFVYELLTKESMFFTLFADAMRRLLQRDGDIHFHKRVLFLLMESGNRRLIGRWVLLGSRIFRTRASYHRSVGDVYVKLRKYHLAKVRASRALAMDPENESYRNFYSVLDRKLAKRDN
jgi:hypothetical protein